MSQVLLLAGLAFAMMAADGSQPTAARASRGFCERSVVHDYEAPLNGMPQRRRPPSSGRLPFGPSKLRLERFSDRLVVGSGRVGVRLSNEGGKALRSLSLGVSAVLVRVNRRGRATKVLRHRRLHIDRLGPFGEPKLSFAVPGVPTFYRVDIFFFDAMSARRLAKYSEYFRVLRPTRHVRLASSSSSVMPGGSIYFRFLNGGTSSFVTGLVFRVERWAEAGWQRDDLLTPKGFPMPAYGLGPGGASRCQHLTIPDVAVPGWYRIVKEIEARPPPRGRRHIRLAAPFRITS